MAKALTFAQLSKAGPQENPANGWGVGIKIYNFNGRNVGYTTGHSKRCTLEGCKGIKLHVLWRDGRRSWPCCEGLTAHKQGFKIQ